MRAEALTASLAELVSAGAARRHDEVAIACGKRWLTYAELDRAVANLAEELRERGIEPGFPVAVVAGIGLEFPVAAFAVLRLGAVVVPISPLAPAAEVTQLLKAANVEMLLSDSESEEGAWAAARAYDPHCGVITIDVTAPRSHGDVVAMRVLIGGRQPAPAPRVAAGSPAVILFTSGSTGRPKGVVHSHESLYRNCFTVAYDMVGLTRKDVMLGALPLAHSFGISAVLNASLLAGARLELLPRFDADEAWHVIREAGVTVLTGVPTMYRRLAEHRRASRNTDVRAAVVSGAPCPPDLARTVLLGLGVPLIERYGMTEASPLTWRYVSEGDVPGDVGRPGWGVHLRATSAAGQPVAAGREGHIEVMAPSMMLRYLDPAETREAFREGWFRTGDLGIVREDGGLTLTGREKDVILRGGYTVSAREVQLAVERHPAVAEAAVLGVPDADMGEEIVAAVIPRRGKHVTDEDLDVHAAGLLATYKRPRRWLVVDELPRTPLGKVKRDAVLKLVLNGTAPPGEVEAPGAAAAAAAPVPETTWSISAPRRAAYPNRRAIDGVRSSVWMPT